MNTTTLFPLSIIWPKVGQSDCFKGFVGGTYVNGSMPESTNVGCQMFVRDLPSGFVNTKVRTSSGWESSHPLTFFR